MCKNDHVPQDPTITYCFPQSKFLKCNVSKNIHVDIINLWYISWVGVLFLSCKHQPVGTLSEIRKSCYDCKRGTVWGEPVTREKEKCDNQSTTLCVCVCVCLCV
jgi:hypothetical protein